jgi:hypothetical protein
MPNESEVDQILSEFRDWCNAEYGRKAEAARALRATRQQVYDWTTQRKRPSIEMWLQIQAFVKSHRPRKTGAKT